jgi:hypothetical protein
VEPLADDDQVLHELRMRGAVALREPAGDDGGAGKAGQAAEGLVSAGFAVVRREQLMLTPAGRQEADRRLCLVGQPGHDRLQLAYERFGPLNRNLLQICTDWQVRGGGVPNDHRDSVYDWGVIDRLVALDEQAGALVRGLGNHVPRFIPYRERMRGARRRVEDGDQDWLLSPRIDSYHTVWMQLHEDLLVGLGIQRGDESDETDGPAGG